MIAVDRRYNSKRREDLEGSPECLSVEIECTKRVFYSDCFISSQTTPHQVSCNIENIVKELYRCNLLIMGDFNAPGINWTNLNVHTDNFYCKQKCSRLLNFVSFLDLRQHNYALKGVLWRFLYGPRLA